MENEEKDAQAFMPEPVKEEYDFKKVLKVDPYYMPKTGNTTMAVVSEKSIDWDYVSKYMEVFSDYLPGGRDIDNVLKLQDMATRMKVKSGDTTFSVEPTLDAMKGLEKAGFFTIRGTTIYWRRDSPLLVYSKSSDNVLIVAPRVEV
jgi:hypothetical protein